MSRDNYAEDGWLDLLAAVLRGSPKLPDALCRGRSELFDATNGGHDDIARAVALCRRCPALESCRQWATGRGQLTGVVAGRYRQTRLRYDEKRRDTE